MSSVTATAAVPMQQGNSSDMLSEKAQGKQRESATAPTPSRSQSPTGTAGRPASTIASSSAAARRDRVSVGSRMNKSIVVRPRECRESAGWLASRKGRSSETRLHAKLTMAKLLHQIRA